MGGVIIRDKSINYRWVALLFETKAITIDGWRYCSRQKHKLLMGGVIVRDKNIKH